MNQLFGTEPLSKLLRSQAIPASVGILVMSIYGIVDTIFVGRWVGSLGIGAITVVMPITFMISSIGMALGVGGASIISRAFGEEDDEKANVTFGNLITLTLGLAILFVVIGFLFKKQVLGLFGGREDLFQPSVDYFNIVLLGVPFLAWAMMSNNVIRAIGHPKMAMITLLIPSIINIVLDPIFIVVFDMGIKGAAWATSIAYFAAAVYTTIFFFTGNKQLKLSSKYLTIKPAIIKEVFAIGSVTLARQGTISVLSIVLNNTMLVYGGALAVSVYGIINRVMMFANFPALGITQGFVPILGFNYGAKLFQRVKDLVGLSMKSATFIALIVFAGIMIFTKQLVNIFTTDQALIEATVPALRWVFLATPLIAINLIGSAYFQAIGKARPALLLTLTKQGFFLIPLLFLLPLAFGTYGIWYSFPIADVGAALVTFWFLRKEMAKGLG